LDARRAAYADLWTACDVHRREVEAQVTWRRDRAFRSTGDDPGIGSSEPARRALIAIQLVSRDDVVKAAAGLYSATVSLGARFHYDAKDPFPTPLDVPAWNQALKSRDEAAGAFQAIAAKDVGKPT